MPRVLCLHGQGTSADIFRSQTASFRHYLDNSWDFDFVNGPFAAVPAPGISLFYKSPTYSFYSQPTVSAIHATHQWLLEYIDTHGPYDMVCCFSQGCSVIGSLLLYQGKANPSLPLPFKSAVFICGGLPLAVLEDIGLPVSAKAKEIDEETIRLLKETASSIVALAANPAKISPCVGLWDNTSSLLHDPKVCPKSEDVFGLNFTAFPKDVRITIPTAHILGGKDPRWPAGHQLAAFYDGALIYDHGGGHEIPRRTDVSLKIAELMKTVSK